MIKLTINVIIAIDIYVDATFIIIIIIIIIIIMTTIEIF